MGRQRTLNYRRRAEFTWNCKTIQWPTHLAAWQKACTTLTTVISGDLGLDAASRISRQFKGLGK
jgi:hypothetical protein